MEFINPHLTTKKERIGSIRPLTGTERLAVFFATGFGVGYIRLVPATFGTLLGIPLFWGLSFTTLPVRIGLVLALAAFSIYVSGIAEQCMKSKDPHPVVIDEVVGYVITTLVIPFSLTSVVVSFVIFRLADIIKPFPITLSQRVPGGLGIVLDDILAGILSALILLLIF
jgi:phosphatidylglycerophosphatase A